MGWYVYMINKPLEFAVHNIPKLLVENGAVRDSLDLFKHSACLNKQADARDLHR